ncbi:MAG: zinc-binding dehydrogenase [Alphaproteobacteria bacterium]|nr:zinc-binding dehydrogenase [Alphaproteobacteria bacterium]
MKAWVFRAYGPAEQVLRLEDVPTPEPGPGEVLVEVRAVTVNRARDLTIIAGRPNVPHLLPMVPGVDPAGRVAALGEGVEGFAVDDRVTVCSRSHCGQCRDCLDGREGDCREGTLIGIHRWGGYAEYCCVPVESCERLAPGPSFAEAAVVMRHFPTAFQLLDDKAGLRAGEWVLVMGAGGGLGSTGVQAAKLMGATVIAGAGAEDRVRLGIEMGADFGINYRTHDLVEEVMRLTDGRGVDVVFENISDPTTWPRAFASLAYAGRLVTAGAHGGGKVELDASRLYLRRHKVIGGAGASRRNVETTLKFAGEGKLKTVIEETLSLAALTAAFDRLGGGDVVGKLVIDPTLG